MASVEVFNLPSDLFDFFYHEMECDRCGYSGCEIISFQKCFHEQCLFMEECECCREPGCDRVYDCSHTFHSSCVSCEDCPTCNSIAVVYNKRILPMENTRPSKKRRF